ncbi:MAG: hypothetical protein AAGA37_17385 [Actinomycetota bacterium]
MGSLGRFNMLWRSVTLTLVATVVLLLGAAAPAGAQYGDDEVDFFTDPRVPIDETFSASGSGCPAGSIVDISIDGVPGVIASTIASAAGNYAIADIPLPEGLSAGSDLDVRATCEAATTTSVMTLLCYDGQLPIDGECEDGSDGIVGGIAPTTTTTIAPAPNPGSGDDGSTTGGDESSPGGSGGSADSGSGSGPNLAITGASLSERLVQIGVTLFAIGFVLILAARRRITPIPA